MYSIAAETAATFIQAHMYISPGIIVDTFEVSKCTNLNVRNATSGSGFAIWGLSVLATKNASWTPLYVVSNGTAFIIEFDLTDSLHNLITTSTRFPPWTRFDGILIEGLYSMLKISSRYV